MSWLYFQWFLRWLVELPLLLLSYPLVMVLVLFREGNHLPRTFWWFETYDNDLTGDASWKKACPYWDSYWGRVFWLWRNPLGSYGYLVNGFWWNGEKHTFFWKGIKDVSNLPGKNGCLRVWVSDKASGKLVSFCLYYVRQYRHFPNKCVRLYCGWKIQGLAESGSVKVPAQLVFSPSFWMRFGE